MGGDCEVVLCKQYLFVHEFAYVPIHEEGHILSYMITASSQPNIQIVAPSMRYPAYRENATRTRRQVRRRCRYITLWLRFSLQGVRGLLVQTYHHPHARDATQP